MVCGEIWGDLLGEGGVANRGWVSGTVDEEGEGLFRDMWVTCWRPVETACGDGLCGRAVKESL